MHDTTPHISILGAVFCVCGACSTAWEVCGACEGRYGVLCFAVILGPVVENGPQPRLWLLTVMAYVAVAYIAMAYEGKGYVVMAYTVRLKEYSCHS